MMGYMATGGVANGFISQYPITKIDGVYIVASIPDAQATKVVDWCKRGIHWSEDGLMLTFGVDLTGDGYMHVSDQDDRDHAISFGDIGYGSYKTWLPIFEKIWETHK